MPQYTQNIIEKFGPEKLPTGWPWRLFLTSFILFGLSLLTYIGLSFGYKVYLNNQIEKKDRELSQLATSISKVEQEQLIKFYYQIQNLKGILDNHIINSNLLPFLEKNTNKKVFYTKAEINVDQKTLRLEGRTLSFEILAQQLEAFNRVVEVERLIIKSANLIEGLVNFDLSLILKPEIFKQIIL